MPPLIQPLFDGPVDIVGDVHGEIGALRSLLQNLGYDEGGNHPEDRRLVFLGDLTDRGPDSPAVVDLVRTLVDARRAQCVLGNHEVNILLNHRKPENKWFWGEDFFDEQDRVVPQRLADSAIQQRVLNFCASLPIALERDDLRIVHACWDHEMVAKTRAAIGTVTLYEQYREQIDGQLANEKVDPIARGLCHQNRNPVKLLTSGPEERVQEPITAGGRVRYEQRVIWWNDYRGAFCVFGHYGLKDGEDRGNASSFCVDFGIGKRWIERRDGRKNAFSFKLAAVRFPERHVVFDHGEVRVI